MLLSRKCREPLQYASTSACTADSRLVVVRCLAAAFSLSAAQTCGENSSSRRRRSERVRGSAPVASGTYGASGQSAIRLSQ